MLWTPFSIYRSTIVRRVLQLSYISSAAEPSRFPELCPIFKWSEFKLRRAHLRPLTESRLEWGELLLQSCVGSFDGETRQKPSVNLKEHRIVINLPKIPNFPPLFEIPKIWPSNQRWRWVSWSRASCAASSRGPSRTESGGSDSRWNRLCEKIIFSKKFWIFTKRYQLWIILILAHKLWGKIF